MKNPIGIGLLSIIIYIVSILLTLHWFDIKLAIVILLWLSGNNLENHLRNHGTDIK
jgi:hypothetical protein